jgi:hypothetical protein
LRIVSRKVRVGERLSQVFWSKSEAHIRNHVRKRNWYRQGEKAKKQTLSEEDTVIKTEHHKNRF